MDSDEPQREPIPGLCIHHNFPVFPRFDPDVDVGTDPASIGAPSPMARNTGCTCESRACGIKIKIAKYVVAIVVSAAASFALAYYLR